MIDTWKTKEGKTIKIVDMSDNHLINTIKYLKGRMLEFENISYPSFQGSEAQRCAELEYEAAEERYCLMIEMRRILLTEKNWRKL